MKQKNYACCKYFESTKCPNVGSEIMQRIFSPDSVYKGAFSNIADDWDILFALDLCSNCNDFEHKTFSGSF